MHTVTIVFKNGSCPITFEASDITLHTSTEDATYGQLVGYDIKTAGTYTSYIYIDVKEVAAVLGIGYSIVEEKESESDWEADANEAAAQDDNFG